MITPSSLLRWGLPVLLLGVAARGGRAQDADPESATKPVTLDITQVYLQADGEYQHEAQSFQGNSSSASTDRTILQPVVGVGMVGSVYHPNLLQYDINPELGLDWEDYRSRPGGGHEDANFLQRYRGTIDILREKPFASSLFGSKDVTYRDYDFFTRVRVDGERYGARSGYSTGPVPFSVTVQHNEEQEPDVARRMSLSQDLINARASNKHRDTRGDASLDFNFDDSTRENSGPPARRTIYKNLSLRDTELFGHDDWVRVNSSVNYVSVADDMRTDDRGLFQERVELTHTPRFNTYYDYSTDLENATDLDAVRHRATIGLSHQLYENLTSSLGFRGLTEKSESPGGTSDATRIGFTWEERYTRRISDWGRLSLGGGIAVDREERESTGTTITVVDESHVLNDSDIQFLNNPLVDLTSVRVTDGTGSQVYLEGLDYRLIAHGAYTEIQRLPGGRIPKGSAVLVDYLAAQQPSSNYTSYSDSAHFRFDFFNGLVGVYGRWNRIDYSGGENMVLRSVDDKTVGIDSTWEWIRAGAEYEIADANVAPYTRTRFYEQFTFQAAEATSLGVNFDQTFAEYQDTGLHQDTYGVIVHCLQRFNARFSWNVEGGVLFERGMAYDRDLATARTEINYSISRLTVKLGYEFNNEAYGLDEREKHRVYVRLRRTFR